MTVLQAYYAIINAFYDSMTEERGYRHISVDHPATDILVAFNDSSVYVIADDRMVFAFPRTEWSIPMFRLYARHVFREIFKT